MIIAQITDLHIGFHGKGNPCENTQRLDIIIKSMRGLKAQPDLMLVTGDLVESGEKWAYEQLKESLAVFDFPVFMALGNHDKRENFQSVFPDVAFADGFLQYTIDNYPVRIIVLDTLEEGRHGGSFGEKRAKWLEERLSEQTDKPTILALHHPPIKTGINWMTADPNSEWVKTLEGIVSRHKHVIHMVAGHIHRSIFKKFAGTTISVCPAVAPQVKLELAELDLDLVATARQRIPALANGRDFALREVGARAGVSG